MVRILESNECFEIFINQEGSKLCFKRKEQCLETVELVLRFSLIQNETTHVIRLPQKRIVLFNTNIKSISFPKHNGTIDIRIRDEARKKIYCYVLKNNEIKNNKKEFKESKSIPS